VIFYILYPHLIAMATNKTIPTATPIGAYLAKFPPPKQKEAQTLIDLMQTCTAAPPVVWGTSIVGFGQYRYRYASGHTGDWFYCGFALRKQAISLYLSCDLKALSFDWEKPGLHYKGVGCVYVKKLEHIDLNALDKLIAVVMQDLPKQD